MICDRWYRYGAQFSIEMLMDKGSVLPVVAARKRVRATVRKRSLSDSQEESKNLENRKKIFLHLYLTSCISKIFRIVVLCTVEERQFKQTIQIIFKFAPEITFQTLFTFRSLLISCSEFQNKKSKVIEK